MRYPEGLPPDPSTPYGESMHNMLSLSMFLSVVIGIALLYVGKRGNIMWMKVWSAALIALSVAYLLADWFRLI